MTLKHKAGRSKRAKAAKQLTADELFFYDNAGYNHNPKTETPEQGRIRCAKSLALAETIAKQLYWSYEWEFDQDADLYWMSDEEREKEHEVLVCVLKNSEGKILEVLGGITDADRNYGRVIEAELADGAIERLNQMRISAFAEPITAAFRNVEREGN